MARSSLAGIAAYHYFKKTKTPFTVESFEPHADYMIDAGEWKSTGIKARLLNNYESKIKDAAAYLLPVANQYKDQLILQGVAPNKLITLPCTVDHLQFAHNTESRTKVRRELKINSEVTVGIYVGKFGGLYQKDKAFQTFKHIGAQFEHFEMIILSPTDKKDIETIATSNNYPIDKLHILSVKQKDVASYLSAADISFATYKSFPSNQYLSPIKIGEYWAAGLFTCVTNNVGDDSAIIEKEHIGSIIEKNEDISVLLKTFKREDAVNAALKYRNRNLIKEAYDLILNQVKPTIS
jgi:hypothetical protein